MRKFNAVLIVVVGGLLLAAAARAQVTNACCLIGPKTKLGAFETNTGTVIIKAYEQIGTVTAGGSVMSVRCKEDTDVSTGCKEYGVSVRFTAGAHVEDTIQIDYDELESLLNAIDCLSKIDWSVISLTGFDAVYSTKDGLRMAAFSSRRSGAIEFSLGSARMSSDPVRLTPTEVAQFRALLEQARNKLDSLRKEKT